jgi:hypothetical protein
MFKIYVNLIPTAFSSLHKIQCCTITNYNSTLFKELIAVYFNTRMKHINALGARHIESLDVKACCTY